MPKTMPELTKITDTKDRTNRNVVEGGGQKQARPVRVNVRLSAEEFARIQKVADDEKRSLSDTIRILSLRALEDRDN